MAIAQVSGWGQSTPCPAWRAALHPVSPQPNNHNITTAKAVWELLQKTAIQAQTLNANSKNHVWNHFCLGPEIMGTSWVLGISVRYLENLLSSAAAGTDCSDRHWCLQPWMCLKRDWSRVWATYSNETCFAQEDGPDDLQMTFQPKLSYNSVKCWKTTARSEISWSSKVERILTSSDARSRTSRIFLERMKKLLQNSHSISDCSHIGHAAVGMSHNLLPESWTEPFQPHFY